MNFSEALECMRGGLRVRRAGWNGKGMFVYMDEVQPDAYTPPFSDIVDAQTDPFVVMYTAQGRLQFGWLASQADMFASDWETV